MESESWRSSNDTNINNPVQSNPAPMNPNPTPAPVSMNPESNTSNAPESAKEILNRARAEINKQLAEMRVKVLKLILDLEDITGKQDYKVSILAILQAFPEVPLAYLSDILPDTKLLSEARRSLVGRGAIEETTERNRKILKLVHS